MSSKKKDKKEALATSKKESKRDLKKAAAEEKKRKHEEEKKRKAESKKRSKGKSHSDDKAASGSGTDRSSTDAPVAASSSAAAASSSAAAASSNAGGAFSHVGALDPSLSKFSDVNLSVADGSVHCHSFVLEQRSPALHKAAIPPQKKGKKSAKKRLKHTPVSRDFSSTQISKLQKLTKPALTSFLSFLYGGSAAIDFEKMPLLELTHLAMTAKTFESPRLLKLSKDAIRSRLDMNNVYEVLKCAHDNNEEEIEAYCMDFAHKNIKSFVSAKDRLKTLGMDLVQTIVEMSLEEYVPMPEDKDPVPKSTLVADFQEIYEKTCQGTIYADGHVILQGSKISFHKALLAAHAKSFASLFPPSGAQENLTEMLQLCKPAKAGKDDRTQVFNLEPDTFHAMLRFIYFGDKNFPPLAACNLGSFPPRFELTQLQELCQHTITNNIKADTVLDILRVSYLQEYSERPDMKEVKKNSLAFVAANGKSVNFDPLMSMNTAIAVDILKTIQASHK